MKKLTEKLSKKRKRRTKEEIDKVIAELTAQEKKDIIVRYIQIAEENGIKIDIEKLKWDK